MSIKSGEMANILGCSRQTGWRLAKQGKLAGARQTKGGHHYWLETPSLLQRKRETQSTREAKKGMNALNRSFRASGAARHMWKRLPIFVKAYQRMIFYWSELAACERTFVIRELERTANCLTEMRRRLKDTPVGPATGIVFDLAEIPVTPASAAKS